jgi:hypothetical protein
MAKKVAKLSFSTPALYSLNLELILILYLVNMSSSSMRVTVRGLDFSSLCYRGSSSSFGSYAFYSSFSSFGGGSRTNSDTDEGGDFAGDTGLLSVSVGD